MAKLSVHGTEIGRLTYTTYTDAYMADGKILRNRGHGWKLQARAKDGMNIQDVFARNQQKQIDFLAKRPAMVAYRKCLHSLAGCSKRWKLALAVELMPDDPDGVWSEACDGYGDNVHADIDEVSELCKLYLAAMAEKRAFNQTAVTA